MDPLAVEFLNVDIEKVVKKEKKQKEKEKKRLKKEKKQKKEAKKRAETPKSSSDSEEDDKDMRVDEPEPAKPLRDDWMTSTQGRNILTGEVVTAKAPGENSSAPEKPQAPAKELNTYLANGGDGLPPSGAGPKKPVQGIGDGGASWRLKALKRAQTRAEEEGRDLQEVVSERFGSMAKLTEGLTNQRAAHAKAHLHAQRDRLRQKDGGEAAGYLQDVGSGRGQMRRPDPGSSLSWKKDRRPGSKGDEETDRKDRRIEGREKDNKREKTDRRESRSEQDRRDSRHSERRSMRDPLGRPDDAAVLRNAAGAINAFSSDGSFMDQFQAEETAAERPATPPAHQSMRAAQDPGPPGRASPATGDNNATGDPRSKTDQNSRSGGVADVGKLTEGDNKSAATALRARLLGRPGGTPSTASTQPTEKRRKVELLPAVDAEGRAAPGAFGREGAGKNLPDNGRKPKRVQRYQEGEKQRYFADDDSHTLEDLVKEQRYAGAKDIDANLADNIARKARFRERDLDVDDEYDVDGGLDMYESRNSKVTKEKAAKRQRTAQISDLRRSNNAMDNCNLCFGSTKRAKHLTIALGQTAYLALPNRGRLAPLHCTIVPIEHISSSRRVDEHVWTEMRNFKKCIIQTFMAQGLNAIFLETAMQLSDLRSHAVVHCIPVDDKALQRAPIVFKKALDEAESEWSQHHAKAVIDTKIKGLRGSIPANFPYLFVEFGLSAGYVHVIDNEEKFDKDFGRSIMAGLLKLPAESQHRGARAEPLPVQQKLAADFAAAYEPYDWTKQLA